MTFEKMIQEYNVWKDKERTPRDYDQFRAMEKLVGIVINDIDVDTQGIADWVGDYGHLFHR